jgi:hypothetical protein
MDTAEAFLNDPRDWERAVVEMRDLCNSDDPAEILSVDRAKLGPAP